MKSQKNPKFVFNAIMLSLLAIPATMSADVDIAQQPLFGVSKVTPALVLALSVEYPTAGIAYSQKASFGEAELGKKYIGYFDNEACYEYVQTIGHGNGGFKAKNYTDFSYTNASGRSVGSGYSDAYFNGERKVNASGGVDNFVNYGDGYFRKVGKSGKSTELNYTGLCNHKEDRDSYGREWSGNFLNFATMSAIDIVRKELTGGNRAKGVGASETVYRNGDTASDTYLRRSMMWDAGTDNVYDTAAQLGTDEKFRTFDKSMYTHVVNDHVLIDYLIPHNYIARLKEYNNNNNQYGWPKHSSKPKDIGWGDFYAANECKFSNSDGIVITNNGTGFHVHLYAGIQYDAKGEPIRNVYGNLNGNRIQCGIPNTVIKEDGSVSSSKWMNAVVKVDGDKPRGLLQEYSESNGLRTAVIGYISDNNADGGVLRAKMRNVSGEINPDKTFKQNPDGAAENNSGVINYLNKFGDAQPYDTKDPVSELYYTAIRYLRNGAWEDGATEPKTGTKYPYTLPSPLTAFQKDAFPVITDWDDPMQADTDVVSDTRDDRKCYAPAIIVLGDSNTHADNNIPNFPGSSIGDADNVAKEKDGTTSYQKVCQLQGRCTDESSKDYWYESSGANIRGADRYNMKYSLTWGMAGMAYWAKTNDVRPDIDKNNASRNPVHISSFFIDVLEDNRLKTDPYLVSGENNSTGGWATPADADGKILNAYYLAGKFASPKYEADKTYTRDYFDSTKDGYRSFWTDSPKDDPSLATTYPLGMPRNYAIANKPEGMAAALQDAFKTVGSTNAKMQSGVNYNNAQGTALDLSDETGSGTLIGEGSGVSMTVKDDGTKEYTLNNLNAILNKARTGQAPLTFRSMYETQDWSGTLVAAVMFDGGTRSNGAMYSPAEVVIWDAGKNLFNSYHAASTPTTRNVESRTDGGSYAHLTGSNAALFERAIMDTAFDGTNYYSNLPSTVSAQDLVNYILGNSSLEGVSLRTRKNSLMGTSIYSTALPILHNTDSTGASKKVKSPTGECTYLSPRTEDFVVNASNEGMLHIFDMTGREVYAYMPQVALPYIANYASLNYQHRFVNDGAATLHEVCEGGVAKTYLVGTTGRGTAGVYVIDVTTSGRPNGSGFHAVREINNHGNDKMGQMISQPLMMNDSDGNNVLVFSSGYNNSDGKGYLHFYNMTTGSTQSVALGDSGVGAPFGFDSDNDGLIDRFYVGDYNGKVYRVKQNSSGGWSSSTLFAGEGLPVISRPYAAKVQDKTVVLFGTGGYLTESDLYAAGPNYAYGIFDDDTASPAGVAVGGSVGDTGASPSFGGATSSNLLRQEMEVTSVTKTADNGRELKYYGATSRELDPEVHKGWRLELPSGYVVTSDSGVYGPANEVTTYTITRVNSESGSCQMTGSTMFVAVDSLSGGAYKEVLFDVNNDGKYNAQDMFNGGSMAGVEVDLLTGIATTANTNNTDSNVIIFSGSDTDGSSEGDTIDDTKELINGLGKGGKQYRRISWRLLAQ
ncbi:MAG: hypothetical protein J6V99_05255 [Neisseriaceae bacterium]|nr:hypothetical protein [Neisseriaceae bacterium]